MIDDCTALILAGGDSRRMGQDKAGLILDGKSLLERVTATMQQVFPKVVVSVRQLRAEVDLPQVCDEHEASGPLAGLIAGLAQADTPWVFAVACDMPFVSAKVVEHLAGCRGKFQAVVPVVGGYEQPLAAFYAKSSLEKMRASLAAGDRSLRGALEKLEVNYVNEAELRAADPQLRSFFDLDTPQDFQAAQK
ncbi:MAG: molybdenum cofactor guanylyltransferase [Gammaproteobacteria bacterium]|nr:molybdenum cofactor guanylyltransferase [Gammaproteobacteria bacterium]MBU1969992.1 molybdenum cofactor guanylyltransferase [Gammaproteobacteria bacterium]